MLGQPQASQKSNNYNTVTEFILVGFSLPPHVRYILFTIFFLIYMMTLTANMLIMLAIRMDSSLHTPMYFFLLTLSLSETCYTFVIIPNMLATLLATGRAISLGGCALQMYFFLSLAATNCCLLAVMGYDRYVVICQPLHYPVLMNPRVCVQLVAACFSGGFLFPILMVSLIFHVSYCGPNRINHFFCDTSPVLQLACTDSKVPESIVYLAGVIFIIMDLLLILISYIFILTAILKISSAQGRHKAFSTCAAHLTVVIVHYGCAGIIYLRPKSARSLEEDKLITVTYTVFTPLLNPIVYSLRNKEVRLALQRTQARIFCPQEA